MTNEEEVSNPPNEPKLTAKEVIYEFMTSENSSSLPYFRVADLMTVTNYTRPTVQKALNELVSLGKIKKSGFQQRVGYIYTPVANDKFAVRINEETLDLRELLSYIINSSSPHKMVAEEQWRNFMKIFMSLVLQSEENVPYKLEDVMKTIQVLRNETIELSRLLNTMLNEFTSETTRMQIERDLDAMKKSGSKFSPSNYMTAVMNLGKKVA